MPGHPATRSDKPLSNEMIAHALGPFSRTAPTSGQIGQIRNYVDLLVAWNQRVSLTAVDDPREIVSRHFGESIFAIEAVPIHFGRLADVGSGAGFPGLPLTIFSERLEVVLMEPNLKKSAFLNEVKAGLDLQNVEVSRSRYEDYRSEGKLFDFICARALGDYRRLLRWAGPALASDGRVVLWLGEEDSISVGRTPGWSWDVPIRMPESNKRVLQVGRPSKP